MKRFLIMLLAAVLILSLAGCGNDDETVIKAVQDTEEGSGELIEAVYYHGDDNAEKLIEEKAELPLGYGVQDVLDLLFEKEVLNERVRVNSSNQEGEELLSIDLSHEFQDQLRSCGTAGEFILMGSLVNTLIKNFEVSGINISIEGQCLESGHEIYDYTLNYFEN